MECLTVLRICSPGDADEDTDSADVKIKITDTESIVETIDNVVV